MSIAEQIRKMITDTLAKQKSTMFKSDWIIEMSISEFRKLYYEINGSTGTGRMLTQFDGIDISVPYGMAEGDIYLRRKEIDDDIISLQDPPYVKQKITVSQWLKMMSSDNLNQLARIINQVLCDRHNSVLKNNP
jgi:hypothetical protein